MDFYAHTISPYDDFMLNDLEKLEDILSSGYLLSRRYLNLNKEDSLFNGMDYISLCDLSKRHDDYSSYYLYTTRGLSLLFDKNIDVIIPNYIILNDRHLSTIQKMHELGLKGRYSDLRDEVQVKDKLSLEYLKGASIPLSNIQKNHSDDYVKYYLYFIKSMLSYYKFDVPIYNLDNNKKLDKMIKM